MTTLTPPENVQPARNPDLSPIRHHYLVQDDQGRQGIASLDVVYQDTSVLFVRPVNVAETIHAPDNISLPSNAIIMTATAWHRYNQVYKGMWYDDTRTGHIQETELRTLTLICDCNYNGKAI